MVLTTPQLDDVLNTLRDDFGTSPGEVFLLFLRNTANNEHQRGVSASIIEYAPEILTAMESHQSLSRVFFDKANESVIRRCTNEVAELSLKVHNYHFNAKTMTEEQIRAYQVGEAVEKTSQLAPVLWKFLMSLLSSDEDISIRRIELARRRHEKRSSSRRKTEQPGDIEMSDDGGEEGGEGDDDDDRCFGGSDDEPDDGIDQAMGRRQKLMKIRGLLCASIFLKSTNQHCNAFQSVVGMFLNATNTPETVREFLSSLGVSITTTSINSAVRSLSTGARKRMEELGRSFRVLFAYDNLDMEMKQSVPTVETEQDNLVHLTTGTMLPLHPDVTQEDLDCSEELWERCPPGKPSGIPWMNLVKIHAKPADDEGLLQRDRFNRWKFLYDLVHHGPEYFRRFKSDLGSAEVLKAVKPHRTFQVPNRTLDLAPSTPATNARAIEELLAQAGIEEPKEGSNAVNIGNQVLLISGDLLTGERIRSLLISRSEEQTPWRRMQFVVYVMGLFHLKMAAAEAIWRIFIRDKNARQDETSLMELLSQIRPQETGKLGSKPGFRRMHEAIEHVGIVLRLDCWRLLAVETNEGCKSLDDFADQKPEWKKLVEMATKLCRTQVAAPDIEETMRSADEEERDAQHENNLIRQQYFLLYEELSYGMNHGDIDRIESCFVPWIMIFAGCGKHKYAAELQRYLEDVHFRYPPGLKEAVRNNILCNPTGEAGKFRGIDWLVEHNNLYIKRIYGGKYSNHTKEHIISQSPLIQVYKDTRMQFEQMFCLEHKTIRHSPPKMTKTFQILAEYMRKEKVNEVVRGRKTKYMVPDVMGEGLATVFKKRGLSNLAEDGEDEELIELQDDGGLDL
ncbi:hypothetical protein EYR40_001372 [Pleurotus pulmonarius]|nr:hypothetical protein EYR38_004611 [Pleurotus pulmonarius]KAF4609019.1 hypothetical protein EYR40_001372 [Pleurotus pulmonarius]